MDNIYNLFAVALEAVTRAARQKIELKAASKERVRTGDEKGHYLWLERDLAQIVAVDDHRSASKTYDDLIPGYRLIDVIQLPFASTVPLDDPGRQRSFVAINYLRVRSQYKVDAN